MAKIMTVDVLSSIKGATPSKSINDLFDVIKTANNSGIASHANMPVSLEGLREDTVVASSAVEKAIIVENFPESKNGYLVVSKIIED